MFDTKSMKPDIIIKNGLLSHSFARQESLPGRSYIKIGAGVILEIGPMEQCPDDIACDILDASGCLIVPGLINCHCHGAMTLFRGLADDLELMDWLENHIFPAEAQSVNKEMVYWGSKLAAAEMIRGGITTVADGYFYENEAAKAYAESGIRAVAAQGIIDFPAPGVPDPSLKFQLASAFIENWQGHQRIYPAVFAHSPYTCGPETLQKAKKLAREKGTLFFIHLAETKFEYEEIKIKTGLSPVRYLQSLGLLDSKTVCVHCVWLDEEEIDLFVENNAKIVTCPQSNMKLASGIAPIPSLINRGVTVGLGTDGAASNNRLSMFREMSCCAKLHRMKDCGLTNFSYRIPVDMATKQGAAVLDLDGFIGTIEPGKRADIIFIDIEDTPKSYPFAHNDGLMYTFSGAEVKTVLIDGEVVMKDREILTFNENEVLNRIRQLAMELS